MVTRPGPRTWAMCARYNEGIAVKEIAVEFGVLNPAVWRALRRGGVLPPYGSAVDRDLRFGPKLNERHEAQYRAYLAKQAAVEALRVPDREPCGFCGTRADVGCKHQVAA